MARLSIGKAFFGCQIVNRNHAGVEVQAQLECPHGTKHTHLMNSSVRVLNATLESSAFEETKKVHTVFLKSLRHDKLSWGVLLGSMLSIASKNINSFLAQPMANILEVT